MDSYGIVVSSYAVTMVLGFVVAWAVVMFLAPATSGYDGGGFDRGRVWNIYWLMVLSALLGGKIGHVLIGAQNHVDQHGRPIRSVIGLLKADPWHIFRFEEPGYVWYGGMIFCLLVAGLYFSLTPRRNAWLYADAFAPAVMLGAAVGRVGCFMAGCCYGIPTEIAWGVRFPGMNYAVHPTQIYDAIIAVGVGLFLLRRFAQRRFDGENLASLLMLYSFFRMITESVRGDMIRGFWGPLSVSQWLSIPIFFVGLYIFLSRYWTAPLTHPLPNLTEPV